MNKEKLITLSEFMSEQNISVSEIQQLALYIGIYRGEPLKTGNPLPIAVRYEDKSVSTTYSSDHRIIGLHLDKMDLDMDEFPVPMSFLNGLQNCRQMTRSRVGKQMPSEAQAKLIYNKLDEINMLLEALGSKPIKKKRYWLSDQASKTYLAKAFDFSTGKVVELKRSDGCRVRPILFKL